MSYRKAIKLERVYVVNDMGSGVDEKTCVGKNCPWKLYRNAMAKRGKGNNEGKCKASGKLESITVGFSPCPGGPER